jgi:uncharacterized protein YfaS (alpha-2-macroglobulin family)
MTLRRSLFLSLTALLALASLAILKSFPAPAPDDSSPSATYSSGVLRVSIPYHAAGGGSGQWMAEVLGPDDAILGRIEAAGTVNGGSHWQGSIPLSKPLSIEDLVWHRVRYRFTDSNTGRVAVEGTDSISEILRTPVIHILGQQSYISGAPAALRVIVTDSRNQPIHGPGALRIELSGKPLFTGNLNRHGTAEAQIRFPAGLVGIYPLRYIADTNLGSVEYVEQVRLEDKLSVLLTTEKPIYQPGQTIHVRALALERASRHAAARRPLTFEVEDSRGNKVFKTATETDSFGVASTEFTLAEEVNLGTYHLRALLGETNRAELALNVERYVLPKFKVALDFTPGQRHGYRPGDHVTGALRANYFFGKPVDSAAVTVKATGLDVSMYDAASVTGSTDTDGTYHFDLRLPSYFAGRPLDQGSARVLIEATVKDSAGHSETRGEPVTVSQSPLLITAVPEGGTLAPNLDNQVFILASYADGKPAVADLKVRASGNREQAVSTDAGGVAVVHIAASTGVNTLSIDAADKEGNRLATSVRLAARGGSEHVLLRPDRAVYHAGDRIALRVLSTKARGTVYIDVVKEGQTILTRDVDLTNGQAELTLDATPDLAGTVDCHAYLFGADAVPVGDHRLLFVEPADELKVEATADVPSYKPGTDARIRFRVTDKQGDGVAAALGVQVVDEAVFALAEKQPGFGKVFFYLEQEAMKPRYEIHSLSMPDIMAPVPTAQVERRDRAARALFAATELVKNNRFQGEAGRSVPMAKFDEYSKEYRARFQEQAKNLVRRMYSSGEKLIDHDAWGTELDVRRTSYGGQTTYVVLSAGPDKQQGTGDDMITTLAVTGPKHVAAPRSGASTIEVATEHDRGPNNGRGEISGVVAGPHGGAIENATVTLREIASGATRTARSDSGGVFRLAAILAGEYEIRVSAAGDMADKRIRIEPRDRAMLTVRLGSEVDVRVALVAMPLRMRVGGNVRQVDEARLFAAGAGGVMDSGVVGGVIGGVPTAAPPPQPAMEMAMPVAKNAAVRADILAPAPHVRSYFPEALYINPEIITDRDGLATIAIPLADSITTWRMALMASTARGALGSGTASLKVFQDFFVDLDLPVTLTQGDRVSIPVAVYNYSGAKGDVQLSLQPADWYALVNDAAEQTVAVESDRVGGAQFTVQANRIGKFKLTLAAHMSNGRADIVVREIEVVPNGREQNVVFNGRLDKTISHEVRFPETSIADASKILVRLYPGPLSQVIEGMDSLLRMPFGCFEQTSSATYPNVLALNYMKRTKKLTPEVHAKAEGFIANGYQRLLTFEVPGGGFSWFGSAPANKILTGYGLMEFYDMSQVHDVDPKVIERTQQWLAGQQQPDGSWKPDTSFINEGATNRYNSDLLRITAYLAWSLENSGYRGGAVDRAKEFVDRRLSETAAGKLDSYTLAVVANFAADYGKDREFTRRAMTMLLDARTEKGDQAWWTSEETAVFGRGESASVETTGLAIQALLKWGEASSAASKALSYIASKKNASGDWGTTQATIMALRALLLSTEKGAVDVRGRVEVALDGKTVQTMALTPENNDLLHQFVFGAIDAKAAHTVDLRFSGKGGLAYQVVGRYFVPWTEKPADEPLSIDVTYDRTHLTQDDIATATARVKNNRGQTANMVMVDLGIPPGFDLLSEDLQDLEEKTANLKGGRLEKFNLTATQAILYFDSIPSRETVTVRFRLRAKYPIRARTFASRAYEYYDPQVQSVARPVGLEVRKREPVR